MEVMYIMLKYCVSTQYHNAIYSVTILKNELNLTFILKLHYYKFKKTITTELECLASIPVKQLGLIKSLKLYYY